MIKSCQTKKTVCYSKQAFTDKKKVPGGSPVSCHVDVFLLQKTVKRLPCLHGQPFDGRKNMEREVRNVRLQNEGTYGEKGENK